MFVPDEPTTSGVCGGCGAVYAMADSGEFVTYSGEPTQYRNTDTVSDSAGMVWGCPSCGQTQTRDDMASGLVQP